MNPKPTEEEASRADIAVASPRTPASGGPAAAQGRCPAEVQGEPEGPPARPYRVMLMHHVLSGTFSA